MRGSATLEPYPGLLWVTPLCTLWEGHFDGCLLQPLTGRLQGLGLPQGLGGLNLWVRYVYILYRQSIL